MCGPRPTVISEQLHDARAPAWDGFSIAEEFRACPGEATLRVSESAPLVESGSMIGRRPGPQTHHRNARRATGAPLALF